MGDLPKAFTPWGVHVRQRAEKNARRAFRVSHWLRAKTKSLCSQGSLDAPLTSPGSFEALPLRKCQVTWVSLLPVRYLHGLWSGLSWAESVVDVDEWWEGIKKKPLYFSRKNDMFTKSYSCEKMKIISSYPPTSGWFLLWIREAKFLAKLSAQATSITLWQWN